MNKTLTDDVAIPRVLLQDLIDDVADYAASREFRKHETAWRDDNLARARAILATQQPEPRDEVTDTERLDWLCDRVVNVRAPLLYGSRDMFWASPTDDDSGHTPSDLRAQIDAARAGEAS